MGVVYKAEDTRLGRSVAMKFAPESLARDPVAVERFQREARAFSALNHPNICILHDIGEIDGLPFLVMECLEGQTMRERIAARSLSVEDILELAIQVADAPRARLTPSQMIILGRKYFCHDLWNSHCRRPLGWAAVMRFYAVKRKKIR